MIQIVCAVKDLAAGLYGRPIFVARAGAAVRSFTDEVNRSAPDNTMSAHPSDFELYQIGTFDDERGILVPCSDGPQPLVRGKDVKEKP